MAKIQIIDSVLPFKCQNQDCAKEYDIHEFGDVVLLWGFIFLIAEEDETALIGITCPECKKITLSKYRASQAFWFLLEVWNHLKSKNLVNSNIKIKQRWCGKYFSVQHVFDIGLIGENPSGKNVEDAISYTVPHEVVLEEYSKQLNESFPFLLIESNIPYLLEIENHQGYKVIPRVLPNPGEYNILNGINYGLDSILFSPDFNTINNIFSQMLEPNSQLYDKEYSYPDPSYFDFPHITWNKKNLSGDEIKPLLDKNDLLFEEYEHFKIGHLGYKRKAFQENIDDFIKELKALRNRIDFELIFRNVLLNKYGRMIYYKTRCLEEDREDYNINAEIEEAGSVEAYVLGEDTYDYLPCAPPEVINNEDSSAVNVPDVPSENAQTTPKEMVIQCCRATAQKLVDQNPEITLPEILKMDEFKKSYEGKKDYIPGSDSGWRNWLKGIYSDKKGRKQGT
jgi:hypothetical protein